jgi:hypothetical protein
VEPFPRWEWRIPERFNIRVDCSDAHLGTAVAERDAVVVDDDVTGVRRATYRELAERTSRFAQALRSLGVERGDRVLIRLPNCVEYSVAFLGAMKRGANVDRYVGCQPPKPRDAFGVFDGHISERGGPVVAFSIVCLVLGWLPLVINTPAMLILTVFTIPHIQQAADFARLYIALAFATVYFGAFVGLLTRLAARTKPRGS